MRFFAALLLLLAGCSTLPRPPERPDPAYHYPRQATATPPETQFVTDLNQYRRSRGLQPLHFDPLLYALALDHSHDMLRRRHMDHAGFQHRARITGRFWCVENAAQWNATPLTAARLLWAWQQSPGHDANLRNPHIRRIGVSVVGPYVTMEACD